MESREQMLDNFSDYPTTTSTNIPGGPSSTEEDDEDTSVEQLEYAKPRFAKQMSIGFSENVFSIVNEKKEVLLSGGAGAISFQAGYMHGLRKIIPLDVLKQFRYGGISAGACVAGFFVMSLYSDKDMIYWFKKHIRYVMIESSRTPLACWNLSNVVVGVAESAYREAHELGVPLDGAFHMYVSRLVKRGIFTTTEPLLIDEFPSAEHFGEAMSASCAIPFVTLKGFSRNFQGVRAVDGGIAKPIPFKNKDSECIFLNVMPRMLRSTPMSKEEPKNMKIIDIAEEYGFSFPLDYWLWGKNDADKKFLQGYLAAQNHEDKLLEAFGVQKPPNTVRPIPPIHM